MRSYISSLAQKGLLLKSNPSIVNCLGHQRGTLCKKISFSFSWDILLDLSDLRNLESRLFNYCSLSGNCRSLTPLGLRIMRLIYLFYFASVLLGKKYFRSPFLVSCRYFAVLTPKVAMNKFYSHSASSHSKVLMKAIFPTVDEFLSQPLPL